MSAPQARPYIAPGVEGDDVHAVVRRVVATYVIVSVNKRGPVELLLLKREACALNR